MRGIIYLILLSSLISCENTTNFFLLEKLTLDGTFLVNPEENIKEFQKHEFVVISNPPDSLPLLLNLVDSFNKVTLNEKLIQSKYGLYSRRFYRETQNTSRNFEPDEGYLSVDRIGDHTEDLIVIYEWEKCDTSSINGEWKLSIKNQEGTWKERVIGNNCKDTVKVK